MCPPTVIASVRPTHWMRSTVSGPTLAPASTAAALLETRCFGEGLVGDDHEEGFAPVSGRTDPFGGCTGRLRAAVYFVLA